MAEVNTMARDLEEFRKRNKEACTKATVETWASWHEGEETWTVE